MSREDVERAFHDLKKEGRKDPAGAEPPTEEEWRAHLRQSEWLSEEIPDDEEARRRVCGQFVEAREETPDGPTYYAQRRLLAECETRMRRERARAARAANAPGPGEIGRLAEGAVTHYGRAYMPRGTYVRVLGPSGQEGILRVECLENSGDRDTQGLETTSESCVYNIPASAIVRPAEGDRTAAYFAERPHSYEGDYYTDAEWAEIQRELGEEEVDAEDDDISFVSPAPATGTYQIIARTEAGSYDLTREEYDRAVSNGLAATADRPRGNGRKAGVFTLDGGYRVALTQRQIALVRSGEYYPVTRFVLGHYDPEAVGTEMRARYAPEERGPWRRSISHSTAGRKILNMIQSEPGDRRLGFMIRDYLAGEWDGDSEYRD